MCVDTPAMWEFSKQKNVPISGKDFKSGQTLMKTVLAPMFKTRMLGVNGWFSTNILGNRDGEVLDDPDNFKTKEVSKLSVIDTIFEPEKYPDLYGDVYHKVRINYYPPRIAKSLNNTRSRAIGAARIESRQRKFTLISIG